MSESQSSLYGSGFSAVGLHPLKRLALFGLALAYLFAGCEKESSRKLSTAEIHAVTQELAVAAAARGATVQIRKSAADGDSTSRDAIRISLKTNSPSESASARAAMLRSLDQVITRHKLTRDTPATSPLSTHVLLRRAGNVTHELEIEAPPAESAKRSAAGEPPRLAIILDDLGADRAAAEAIFALRVPLTISILPGHAHSAEIAEEAHRRGLEVMLHLPMQSVGKEQPEAQELRSGMTATDVKALVDNLLAGVPYAVGVNNHQGSQATSDSALMSELMPELRDKKLFYIDSRTTAATVAYDAAQQSGVRSAFRNVPFLDDVEQVPAIRKQLVLAVQGAREKGEAVAIGHPHSATLQALREFLPAAKAEGVQLVRASELVH